MRRDRFAWAFVLLTLLLGSAAILWLSGTLTVTSLASESSPVAAPTATPTPSVSEVALSPEVKEFIADTYLAHSSEYPDPNEPVEVLRLYLEGQQLLREGRVEQAIALFFDAVESYSECRHAHAGLADALRQRYAKSNNDDDLVAAVNHYTQAARSGFVYGRVRYTEQVAEGLGQLGDAEALHRFFQQALLVSERPYAVAMNYARGLHLLKDEQAEEWYEKAIQIQPEGNVDALFFYAEWLLEQGREEDVLSAIAPTAHVQSLHFLRGVALERSGRIAEAKEEYSQFIEFSRDFPAPAKYRIEGSEAQEGITFVGESSGAKGRQVPFLITGYQVRRGLSYLLKVEAPYETQGGMRAVAWTVRTRVFKGGAPVGYCVGTPSGSTTNDKYKWVICSSGFAGACQGVIGHIV